MYTSKILQQLHAECLQVLQKAAWTGLPTTQQVVRILDAGGDADEVVWEAPRRSDLRCEEPW